MKHSKQRDLILDIINNSSDHPSAYQIHEIAMKTINKISLGTVYRNLNLLVEAGMIKRIKLHDGTFHYDHMHAKHNHFICNNCLEIYDIYDDQKQVTYIGGHKVTDSDIVYKGVCNKCIVREKK